jgi:hypothetical protein
MTKILEFMMGHSELLFMVVGALIGLFLPIPSFEVFGVKIGGKIPSNIKKLLNERIDAFQDGLLKVNYGGDKNIVSNLQLEEETNKLKIDLGLDK